MYVYILVVTSSNSFPYLFWGIFSCWLRFELNQPPSKTRYLWQNSCRMWLSMFSPFWNHQIPGYESVTSELTGEEIQLWVPRLTIWLFPLEKEIFPWQVHSWNILPWNFVFALGRTFLWASTTLLLVHWQSVLKLQDWRICWVNGNEVTQNYKGRFLRNPQDWNDLKCIDIFVSILGQLLAKCSLLSSKSLVDWSQLSCCYSLHPCMN